MTIAASFHAHVYFDPGQREQAVRLRSELDRRLPVLVGRLHDRPIGPHPKAMFQALFPAGHYDEVVTWLERHRSGLDVLVHPETGDDVADHTVNARWLGSRLPLDVSSLAESGITAGGNAPRRASHVQS